MRELGRASTPDSCVRREREQSPNQLSHLHVARVHFSGLAQLFLLRHAQRIGLQVPGNKEALSAWADPGLSLLKEECGQILCWVSVPQSREPPQSYEEGLCLP